jgi:hypothetical protein
MFIEPGFLTASKLRRSVIFGLAIRAVALLRSQRSLSSKRIYKHLAALRPDPAWNFRDTTLILARNPTLVPQTQIEQTPKVRAPIPGPALMFIGHPLNK